MKFFVFIMTMSLTLPAWSKITLDVDGTKEGPLKVNSINIAKFSSANINGVKVTSEGSVHLFKDSSLKALGLSRKDFIDLLKEYGSSTKNLSIVGQTGVLGNIEVTRIEMDENN